MSGETEDNNPHTVKEIQDLLNDYRVRDFYKKMRAAEKAEAAAAAQTECAAAAPVICLKCGNRVSATSKFCPECGSTLSSTPF